MAASRTRRTSSAAAHNASRRPRACVSRGALHDDLAAGDAHDARNHAERHGRPLEDGALLDVRFDVELGQRPVLHTSSAAGETALLVPERHDGERTPSASESGQPPRAQRARRGHRRSAPRSAPSRGANPPRSRRRQRHRRGGAREGFHPGRPRLRVPLLPASRPQARVRPARPDSHRRDLRRDRRRSRRSARSARESARTEPTAADRRSAPGSARRPCLFTSNVCPAADRVHRRKPQAD